MGQVGRKASVSFGAKIMGRETYLPLALRFTKPGERAPLEIRSLMGDCRLSVLSVPVFLLCLLDECTVKPVDHEACSRARYKYATESF